MKSLKNTLDYDTSTNHIKEIKNFVAKKAEQLTIEDALSKICVSPPYFKFKKIYRHNDFLISKITPEQKKNNEVSKITVGESGRHMAILGSVACGLNESSKNYYLAEKSYIKNYSTKPSEENYEELLIAMRPSLIEKRKAKAEGFIFDKNMNVTHEIYVLYRKIATPLFKKFFGHHFRESEENSSQNPYLKHLDLKLISEEKDKIKILLPKITDLDCAGHFSGCPAVPIAFFMHNIGQFCGNHIAKKNKLHGFVITEAKLDLFELMFPDILDNNITVTYEKIDSRSFKFYVEIFQQNKLSGNISFVINLVNINKDKK